jgi:hypothetical protein
MTGTVLKNSGGRIAPPPIGVLIRGLSWTVNDFRAGGTG